MATQACVQECLYAACNAIAHSASTIPFGSEARLNPPSTKQINHLAPTASWTASRRTCGVSFLPSVLSSSVFLPRPPQTVEKKNPMAFVAAHCAELAPTQQHTPYRSIEHTHASITAQCARLISKRSHPSFCRSMLNVAAASRCCVHKQLSLHTHSAYKQGCMCDKEAAQVLRRCMRALKRSFWDRSTDALPTIFAFKPTNTHGKPKRMVAIKKQWPWRMKRERERENACCAAVSTGYRSTGRSATPHVHLVSGSCISRKPASSWSCIS